MYQNVKRYVSGHCFRLLNLLSCAVLMSIVVATVKTLFKKD